MNDEPRSGFLARGAMWALWMLAGCSSSSPQASPTASDAQPASAEPGSDGGSLLHVSIGSSPIRGPLDAWVTMIEFGDFECPYCGGEEPVVEALLAAYPDDLRLVFKNYPLTSIHPYAEGAAEAAVCASLQGDFWPMHDLLFAHQNALDPASLAAYAAQAGVNGSTWQACVQSAVPANAVHADIALGQAAGVEGTPTFVINGTRVLGAAAQSTLASLIETKRAEAMASGIARASYYATLFDSP